MARNSIEGSFVTLVGSNSENKKDFEIKLIESKIADAESKRRSRKMDLLAQGCRRNKINRNVVYKSSEGTQNDKTEYYNHDSTKTI
jgi:hypothetical protein